MLFAKLVKKINVFNVIRGTISMQKIYSMSLQVNNVQSVYQTKDLLQEIHALPVLYLIVKYVKHIALAVSVRRIFFLTKVTPLAYLQIPVKTSKAFMLITFLMFANNVRQNVHSVYNMSNKKLKVLNVFIVLLNFIFQQTLHVKNNVEAKWFVLRQMS